MPPLFFYNLYVQNTEVIVPDLLQFNGREWVVITDLKNMADYIALQYFVFLQKDLATFTTNEGWSFVISGIWRTIRSSKHLRHPKRREI